MMALEPAIDRSVRIQPLKCSNNSSTQGLYDQDFTASVQRFSRHHWNVIDYHLYLMAIEKNRNYQTRITKNYLLTVNGFQQVSLQDFACPSSAFHQVPAWSTPMMMFVSLPILHPPHGSLNRKLVLGFDFKKRHLIGIEFEAAPDHIADMAAVWDQGQTMIDVCVERFLEIVKYTMENHTEILGHGMLRHFHETSRELPTGLDLVAVIQFLQFLDDFADLLWDDGAEFRDGYGTHQEALREMLGRASMDAWFAARDAQTIQTFCQRKMRDVVTSGSFFDQIESESQVGAVKGVSPIVVMLRFLTTSSDYRVSVGHAEQSMELMMLISLVHLVAMFGRLIQLRS